MKSLLDPQKTPEERLAMIHRCAVDVLENLSQYPKNVEDMTETELEIAKPCQEVCGAMSFIRDQSEFIPSNDPNRITPKEAEFLIWALGFVEGHVRVLGNPDSKSLQDVTQRCREIWPKLSLLI